MAVLSKPGAPDWEQIYDSYFPLLFRYSFRFTADKDLVKDLLQDFFVELYLKQEKLAGIRNMRSYLMVAVRRRLVKVLSIRGNHTVPFAEEEHDFMLELSAENKLIDAQLLETKYKYLQKAISALSRRQKEAIYLRFYENLGYEEIAEIMGLKEVKYARTLVYRAIAEIRTEFRKTGSPICLLLYLPGLAPLNPR